MRASNRKFTMAPNDVMYDKTISASARHLYNILLSFAWRKNTAYPGQKLLAELMSVNDRTIRTYLKELEEKGLVSKYHRGLTKTNIYTLYEWISPSQKRKNNPFQSDDDNPPLNGSKHPTNNTQYKKTKGEVREGTHSQPPSSFSDGSQNTTLSSTEIIDVCTPHLQDISYSTGVRISDVKDVLIKMANHYAAEGKVYKDWLAKLTSWIINDLQADKIYRDEDVVRWAEADRVKKENIKVIVSVFGVNWREIPGLRDKLNEYLREQDYQIDREDFRFYLEELKESGLYDEVFEEVDEYTIISPRPDRS